MSYLGKIIKHLKNGIARDIVHETRWIYNYARQYWGKIGIYVLLGLLTTASSLGSSLLSRNLINLVVAGAKKQGALSAIIPLAVLFVSLALARVGLSALTSRVSAQVSLRVNKEIRADIFGKFLNTAWKDISSYHSGDLLNRINSDVEIVASSVLGWIPSLLISLVQFAGVLAVILYFDPWMGLLALIGGPLTGLVFGRLAPRLREYSQEVRDASSSLSAFYTDSLQNLQSVKAFGLVDQFGEKLEDLQKQHMKLALRQNALSVKISASLSLVGMAVSYLCLGWSIFRLWSGRIDFGTMVLFIQLASYLANSANGLLKLGPAVINATVSAKRIMTVLELPREEMEGAETAERLRRDPIGVSVELQDVGFSYRPEKTVLEHVDFRAAPGEVIAVVGPSGSGKTTLLRLLLSLLHPGEGSAKLSGSSGAELPLCAAARTLFSYVPQENALFSGTVAETLQLAKADATEAEMWEALALADLDDVVRAMPQGLDSPIGEDGGCLSEGQGQRLSIARALLHDAPILLLDEATSALDVATERRILRSIMKRYQNKTCIVTTHRPSVLELCTRVYQIQDQTVQVIGDAEIERLFRSF